MALPHRRAPGARAREAGVPPLDRRPPRPRPRPIGPSGSRAGPTSSASRRSPSPDELDALDGKFIWSREYVETRSVEGARPAVGARAAGSTGSPSRSWSRSARSTAAARRGSTLDGLPATRRSSRRAGARPTSPSTRGYKGADEVVGGFTAARASSADRESGASRRVIAAVAGLRRLSGAKQTNCSDTISSSTAVGVEVGIVEVVVPLRPLVADVAEVLELGRPAHGPDSTGRCQGPAARPRAAHAPGASEGGPSGPSLTRTASGTTTGIARVGPAPDPCRRRRSGGFPPAVQRAGPA